MVRNRESEIDPIVYALVMVSSALGFIAGLTRGIDGLFDVFMSVIAAGLFAVCAWRLRELRRTASTD